MCCIIDKELTFYTFLKAKPESLYSHLQHCLHNNQADNLISQQGLCRIHITFINRFVVTALVCAFYWTSLAFLFNNMEFSWHKIKTHSRLDNWCSCDCSENRLLYVFCKNLLLIFLGKKMRKCLSSCCLEAAGRGWESAQVSPCFPTSVILKLETTCPVWCKSPLCC